MAGGHDSLRPAPLSDPPFDAERARLDGDGRIVAASAGFAALLGDGENGGSRLDPRVAAHVDALLQDGAQTDRTVRRVIECDGRTLEIELRRDGDQVALAGRLRRLGEQAPITDVLGGRDVRAAIEQRAAHDLRLEALGRLAHSIGHDFNNAISVILSFSDYLAEELGPEHRLHDDVREISTAATHAAELMRQTQLFAVREEVELAPVDVRPLLSVLGQALRHPPPPGIELRIELADALPPVRARPGLVEQALVHLVENAVEALGARGTVVVRGWPVTLERDEIPADANLLPGEHVAFEVVDDGPGMDAETYAQAFEPLFSTKPAADASGLGLSAVRGAMAQVGGHVELRTGGDGTVARVLVPAAHDPVVDLAADNAVGSGERILVVEDHPAVREGIRRVLAPAGYDVMVAPSADAAERLLAERDAELILSDVMLPGRSGPELVRDLRARSPELRAAFISARVRGTLDGVPVVAKPFTPATLLGTVRAVLDA